MGSTTEDHIAIERLMFRYARCADHKDYAGFGDVFSEDAVFEYMDEPVESLPAIREMMLALEKYPVTQHRVGNVLYEVSGDIATGETYCLASHLRDGPDGTEKIDMAIVYRDELRREATGWRITRRAFNLLWTQTSAVD